MKERLTHKRHKIF